MGHVAKLVAGFPSESSSREVQKLRGEAYLQGLSQFSPDVVRRACEKWLAAEDGDGNENYAFAPSVSQLARLCRLITKTYRVPESRYPAFGSDQEPDPETRKRVSSGFQKLSQTLREQAVEAKSGHPLPGQAVEDGERKAG